MTDNSLSHSAMAYRIRPDAHDDYELDLHGFFVIRGALSADEVAALNDAYDRFPDLANGEWYGNAQRRDSTADTGFELHARLTPARRTIIQPMPAHPAGSTHVPLDLHSEYRSAD